jgi:phage-related holin
MKDPTTILPTLKSVFLSFINSVYISSLHSFAKNLIILTLAFISPVKEAIFAVYFLITVDFITGIWASIKKKQPITSSAMSRTIGKILIYSTTIIVAFVVHKYLMSGFEFPIETMVSGFIALTETKSIFENINRIGNNKFVKDLILLLSNERVKRLPPK